MVGKWHLGYAPEQNPKARGFDQSFALLDGFDLHFKDQPKTIRVTPNTLKMVKGHIARQLLLDRLFTQKRLST